MQVLMKIRLFMLFCAVFTSQLLLSQTPVLQTRIDLKVEHASPEEIFREITRVTGINFSYNSRAIQSDKRVSLNFEQETMETILTTVCEIYDFEYRLVRNQIVIRKGRESREAVKSFTLSGTIRDKTSSETLPGATVSVNSFQTGTISNSYGFFSLTLPHGEYEVFINYLGYQAKTFILDLSQNIRMNLELERDTRMLGEVTVLVNEAMENLEKSQGGRLSVNPRIMEQMPEFAGESGLIKSLQTLPGIQTHSDGSAFFFVRGGNKDQNLILIDEAPVYNPAHLFGFYSVIIPDVAKEINIYKADLPIEKAGRLSSVIDVQTRDGNLKNVAIEGVLNPLMYRFSIEGPLVRDNVSFFTSLRRSNFEWIYQRENPDSDFFIRDFNGKLNWQINKNNRVYFSLFRGSDNYTTHEMADKRGVAWHNNTLTFRWNRIIHDQLFSNVTIYSSAYNYSLFTGSFPWQSGISDLGIRYDLTRYPHPDVTLKYGFSQTFHSFNPGNFSDYPDEATPFIPRVYGGKATETAAYFNREKRISEKWAWNAGIRVPVWSHRGPAYVFSFDDQHHVTDTTTFEDQENIKTYLLADLRLSTRYRINEYSSLRLSWGLNHQNLHLINNSLSPFSSFELWLPSGKNIKPQRARQLALGYSGIWNTPGIEFTAEVYNKVMTNQIGYSDHSKLLLNPHLEGELRFGESHSQGLELSMRRTKGRITGWVSYTRSMVYNQFEELNQGQEYPAFYHRPHDFSIFFSWLMSPKTILSANWIYHTGSAITTPIGFYYYQGAMVPQYGSKNNDRLPDYHRLDISFTWLIGNPAHRYQHSLNFSIYNLYNRHNPISINFNKIKNADGEFVVPQNLNGVNEIISSQKYVSGFLPSITYKFKFK